ncbi:MAG: alpha/beta fold hydrolase [Aquabacterium sp.]|jgi:dipeptidyl aminopeptidase/acylaminoacyl peptidase|uniref:alpha/beta hydrolase n=1 Tax=Aquabacterium sp. TaxID=1872578 RepID=UPI002A36789F|nr:alpha/beta fold hydrolase [Aquabacterium sp.]MDX9842752.1 alpha/beta fold hydrolase [Aquabacterium sp.]
MNLFKALAHRALLWGLRAPRLEHSVMPEGLALDGQHIRPVWIEGEGGSRLFAWYIAPPGPQGVLAPGAVLMHGWGAHAGLMLPAAPWLHEAGLALLVLDARGHGLSSAVDFQSLPRFAQDVEAGLAWLRQQPEVDASRLALIGHSVGAGAVLLSATRQPAVRAVISLSAFAHPAEVMQRWLAQMRIPSRWPGRWILSHVQEVIGARFDEIAPLRSAGAITCPILFVHGQDDETVPFTDALRLAEACGVGAEACLAVPGGHDLTHGLGPDHVQRMMSFLRSSLAPAPG